MNERKARLARSTATGLDDPEPCSACGVLTHPTKRVPLGLIAYQLARYVGLQRHLLDRAIPGSIPVNLFDAMRITAERV